MLTSYLLSRTLVPTPGALRLLRGEAERYAEGHHGAVPDSGLAGAGLRRRSSAASRALRDAYGGWLGLVLQHRAVFIGCFLAFVVGSLSLFPLVGRDFFPSVDAGLVKLHVRARPAPASRRPRSASPRIEETIRERHPARRDRDACSTSHPRHALQRAEPLAQRGRASISPADGQILIALKEHHAPTPKYVAKAAQAPRRRATTGHDVLLPHRAGHLDPGAQLRPGRRAITTCRSSGAPGDDDGTVRRSRSRSPPRRCAPSPAPSTSHLAQVRAAARAAHRRRPHRNGSARPHPDADVASDVLVSLSSSTPGAAELLARHASTPSSTSVAVQTPQYDERTRSASSTRRPSRSAPAAPPQLLSQHGGHLAPDAARPT